MKCREPEDSYEATAACRFCNAHLQPHPFSLFGIRYIRSSGLAFGLRPPPPLVCRLAFERAFERRATRVPQSLNRFAVLNPPRRAATNTHAEQWRRWPLAAACDPIPISTERRRRRAAIPGQTVEKHKMMQNVHFTCGTRGAQTDWRRRGRGLLIFALRKTNM